MHRFTRLAGALALALVVPIAATVAARPFNDPITGSAHGAVFGPDGKQIHVTAEFLARAQQIYLSHVLDSANAAQRAAYESKRTYLDDIARGTPADVQSALMGRSLLLDWLIDEVGPIDSALLKQRNRIIKFELQTGAVSADRTPYSMQPSVAATFSQLGLPVAAVIASGTPPSDEV
ncbi:MAG: hypothetical protein JO090_01910, partial [Rhizobacter sp.]|nr:hypothetical protein [Rhizobacter sp.]